MLALADAQELTVPRSSHLIQLAMRRMIVRINRWPARISTGLAGSHMTQTLNQLLLD